MGSEASGDLTITATGAGMHIAGTINGLAPNSVHGIHIHAGDLGNITADGEGTVHVDLQASRATLHSEQPTDVAGKAIILHAGADDLQSQPSGDSGDRIACGVIA